MRTFAVATPTRGLIHSRTVESVMRAVEHAEKEGLAQRVGPEWWFWSHGLPIPQSHEEVTEKALATDADWVWMIEDDQVVPPTALTESIRTMARTKAGIVAVNYPVGTVGLRWSSIQVEDGEILFCGLGITLIARKVFEKMQRPWFDLTRWYGRLPDGKGATKLGIIDRPFPIDKGGIDVVFCIRAREAGATIAQVPRNDRTTKPLTGAQVRITKQGAASGSGINTQPHRVEMWDTIDCEQFGFQAQDNDRFDIRQRYRAWREGMRALAPWVTGFWMGEFLGGKYDAMHDARAVLARDLFPESNRVLELGSLEGGHTLAISRWADKVVGVEGRDENIRKAEWILKVYEADNASIVKGNLETMRLADLGDFDLVFAVGVLYHMPEPLKLIAQMADAAPDLFLWTHYSRTDERFDYPEFGLNDPLSGMSPRSVWLPKGELLAELRDRYTTVEVLSDDPDWHGSGPALTIAARGAK